MNGSRLRDLVHEEEGATASEYAIMLALLIVAVIAAVNSVGSSTADGWTTNVNRINEAVTANGGS